MVLDTHQGVSRKVTNTGTYHSGRAYKDRLDIRVNTQDPNADVHRAVVHARRGFSL